MAVATRHVERGAAVLPTARERAAARACGGSREPGAVGARALAAPIAVKRVADSARTAQRVLGYVERAAQWVLNGGCTARRAAAS